MIRIRESRWQQAMRGLDQERRRDKADIHLYILPLMKEEENPLWAWELFSRSEKESIEQGLTFEARQTRFASYLWVRLILAMELHIPPKTLMLERTANGRRYLRHSPGLMDFNISHAGNYFALACSRCGHVGVDLAYHDPAIDVEPLTAYLFGAPPPVLRHLPAHDKMERFYDYWVTHEALQKCCGAAVPEYFMPFSMLESVEQSLTAFCNTMYYTRRKIIPTYSLCVASSLKQEISLQGNINLN
jgi:phosphopantetheinyl transferase